MAWSVEGRLPFVDHRVVEFGLGLPDCLKVDGRQGKTFLKHWAGRLLPDNHLWKKKRGFTVPIGQWLQGDYLHRLAEALSGNEGIRQWFRPEAVSVLLRRQQQHRDAAGNLMALLQFAIWHRLFIENPGTRPPPQIDPVQFLITDSHG